MCSVDAAGVIRMDWRGRPAEPQEQSFVAIHHRLFRKQSFNARARFTSHSFGNRPVGRIDSLSTKTAGRRPEKQPLRRNDHLRGAADVGMDNLCSWPSFHRRQRKRFGKAHSATASRRQHRDGRPGDPVITTSFRQRPASTASIVPRIAPSPIISARAGCPGRGASRSPDQLQMVLSGRSSAGMPIT